MLIEVICAFFAAFFFSIIFNISKNELIFCGLNGTIGWLVYLIVFYMTDSVVFSSFLGALAVSILAQIFAKYRKTPVTIFLIPGIITLVPGAGMYRTIYYIVNEDYTLSNFYGIQSIQVAGAIAVAIILVASISKSPKSNVVPD